MGAVLKYHIAFNKNLRWKYNMKFWIGNKKNTTMRNGLNTNDQLVKINEFGLNWSGNIGRLILLSINFILLCKRVKRDNRNFGYFPRLPPWNGKDRWLMMRTDHPNRPSTISPEFYISFLHSFCRTTWNSVFVQRNAEKSIYSIDFFLILYTVDTDENIILIQFNNIRI